jgi:hypothetical protein
MQQGNIKTGTSVGGVLGEKMFSIMIFSKKLLAWKICF